MADGMGVQDSSKLVILNYTGTPNELQGEASKICREAKMGDTAVFRFTTDPKTNEDGKIINWISDGSGRPIQGHVFECGCME